jgi:hypothetical protein
MSLQPWRSHIIRWDFLAGTQMGLRDIQSNLPQRVQLTKYYAISNIYLFTAPLFEHKNVVQIAFADAEIWE